MPRSRVALIVAMLFAVPAAVAALDESASSPAADVAEPVQEVLAAAAEPVTGADPAEVAAEPAESIAQSESAAQPEPMVQPEAAVQPTARVQRAAASAAYPRNDEVGATLLPSLLAYLERMAQQRSHLIARGDAFPTGDAMDQPLPALVAHLDRVDQARIAAAQPQPVARIETAPAAAEPGIPAAGTEALVSAHTLHGR